MELRFNNIIILITVKAFTRSKDEAEVYIIQQPFTTDLWTIKQSAYLFIFYLFFS